MTGLPNPEFAMTPDALYALAADYLDRLEADDHALSDAQHSLLAYCYADAQVEEGGFVQLIAGGYGDYVFANPLADSLRRWGVKASAKVIDHAAALYRRHGADIEALAAEGVSVPELRRRFALFEDADADYYEVCDDDRAAVCAYVAAHATEFALQAA